MPQPKSTNNTRYAFQALFTSDEALRPIVAPIIKATLDIQEDCRLRFANQQLPINLEGEHYGDPQASSYRYEPECTFTKTRTDVVVIGDAVASKGPVRQLALDIQVGELRKKLRVIGDRFWVKPGWRLEMTSPKPFERMAITYENAFGGWDRRHADPNQHDCERRNTVGKGFYREGLPITEPMPLPNIEDPADPIQDIRDKPVPAGCGFTLPYWDPRRALAGTYDQAWMDNRSPLLPLDFKCEFYNAASPGLIAEQYLRGDERVSISNMTAGGHLQFALPNINPPVCEIALRDYDTELPTHLDTVIINTNTMQLNLIWRNYWQLDQSAHDVEEITVHYG